MLKSVENTVKQVKKALQNPPTYKLVKENSHLVLKPLKGAKSSSIWSIKGEDFKDKICLDASKLAMLFKKMDDLEKQNIQLNLEKELSRQIPIDFADAMAVAKSYLVKDEGQSLSGVINTMKKEHPNLFLDMDAIMGRKSKRG